MGHDMNERAPKAVAGGKAVGVTAGSAGVGAIAGFMLDPAKGLEFLKWLAATIKPEALIAMLTLSAGLGIAVATNWFFWQRLNEKDRECQLQMTDLRAECQTEMATAEARWEARFQQMRSDIKEAFGCVADLTKQVTLLAERTRATDTRTRSD